MGENELTSATVDVRDEALLARVRDGDPDAYGVLYGRYAIAARRFARSLVGEADADDVVAEAFASVLSALRRGNGPVGSFAPYLMVSVRHECYRVNRRYLREMSDPDVEHTADGRDHTDAYSALEDSAVIRAAFDSLSHASRRLLWDTVVDHTAPRELAARSGTNPHAVAVAAQRARRALGSAFLNEHVSPVTPSGLDVGCQQARPHIAGFVRGTIGSRRRRRIAEHLRTCDACAEVERSLTRMNQHLREVPPLAAGAVSMGIKAQVVSWFTGSVVPIATSSFAAASVLLLPPDDRHTAAHDAAIEVEARGHSIVSTPTSHVVVPSAEPTSSANSPSVGIGSRSLLDDIGYDASNAGGNANGHDPATTNGNGNGNANGHDPTTTTGNDPATTNGNGNANGHDPATTNGNDPATTNGNGHANGHDPATTNGNANGNANGHDPATTNGNANGHDPATTNGNGHANGHDPATTNGNDATDGNANDPTTTNGNGNGNANGNDPATTNGNGNANANGNDPATTNGNANANGHDPAKTNGNGNANGHDATNDSGNANGHDATNDSGGGNGNANGHDASTDSGGGNGNANGHDATNDSGGGNGNANGHDATNDSGGGNGNANGHDATNDSGGNGGGNGNANANGHDGKDGALHENAGNGKASDDDTGAGGAIAEPMGIAPADDGPLTGAG